MPSQEQAETKMETDCDGNMGHPSQAVTTHHHLVTDVEAVAWDDVIAQIDEEMKRLHWDLPRSQQYLIQKYGVESRVQLSDRALCEFLDYLKS